MRLTVLLIGVLLLFLAGCQDPAEPELDIKPNVYAQYQWEPVIDTLATEYFQGVDISINGEMYVNYWKGWNGSGPTLEPATLISTDGVHWENVSNDSPIFGTWTYLKRHKNTIWAGTPDQGLFYSDDNGKLWKSYTGFNWEWPETIKSNEDQLIISDFRQNKTFISSNDGLSWREMYPKFLRVIDFTGFGIRAFIRGTILESEDGGITWTADSTLLVQEKNEVTAIGLATIDDQIIAAISKGIYKKKVGDTNWTNIGLALPHHDMNLMFQDGNYLIIQTSTDEQFYYSDNLGDSWQQFGQGLSELIPNTTQAYNIVKKDQYLYIATSDGFFKRKVQYD